MKWALLLASAALAADAVETWRFDSLDKIGGHAVKVEGAPRVVNGTVVFDGVKDALFFDVHPLAGAETWTWEVIFRPDVGGAAEQRFFHLQEEGADTRMLFEIRVIDGKWCLDSYAHWGTAGQALMDRAKLHELGKWHAVQAVYDFPKPSIARVHGAAVGGGVGLMLAGIALFSLNDALGKWLLETYSVGELLLVRSAAALILLTPFVRQAGIAAFTRAVTSSMLMSTFSSRSLAGFSSSSVRA